MAAPVLTASLTKLRAGFDVAFPDRDKSSDGWIGDDAHQERTSGHNPDDTAGVSAEYSDSDSKAEVRAIDVDKDLKTSGVSMQDVIDLILATPNDTKRLKYIIFNRTQWAKSNSWRPTNYTGSNPHDHHAHFSGDPAYDEDTSAWSVETMGDDMPYSEGQMRAFPWQYNGSGIGENGPDVARSTLSYFDELLDTCREILKLLQQGGGGGGDQGSGGGAAASPAAIADATAQRFADLLGGPDID